jgi:hypothetical protein
MFVGSLFVFHKMDGRVWISNVQVEYPSEVVTYHNMIYPIEAPAITFSVKLIA